MAGEDVGIGTGSTTIEDDIALLTGDDQDDDNEGEGESQESEGQESDQDEEEKPEAEKKPRLVKKEDKAKSDKEDDKEEEEEEEEPEPDPDSVLTGRPTAKDLKDKYPKIFKNFPELRGVIFREQQFSQVFSDPASAQTALADAEAFQSLRSSIMEGDSVDFVKALKEANGLEQVASSFLPALYQVDKEAHWNAVAPVFQTLVRSFYNNGAKQNDDNIKNAALFLSEFLFGDENVATGTKSGFDEKKAAADQAVREERQKAATKMREAYVNDVQQTAIGKLEELVSRTLDREKDLTPFVRGAAKSAILKGVMAQLQADKIHLRNMDALWAKAERTLSPADKASIINTYLARAKQLVTSQKNKVLSESRGTAVLQQKQQQQQRREPTSGGRMAPGNGTGRLDARRIDWGKTSDMDLLEGRVSYKK